MKMLYVFLLIGFTQFAFAGGPQIKLFTEKLGAIENTPAKNAILQEIQGDTKFGRCYEDFLRTLQKSLSLSKVGCLLRIMNQPVTIEVTLDDNTALKANIRVPEFKVEMTVDHPLKLSLHPNHIFSSCSHLASEVVHKLEYSHDFPFVKEYGGGVVDDIISSTGNGDFFEKRKCE